MNTRAIRARLNTYGNFYTKKTELNETETCQIIDAILNFLFQ